MDTAAHRIPHSADVTPLSAGAEADAGGLACWAIFAMGERRARYTVPVSEAQADWISARVGETVRLTIHTAGLDEPTATDEDTVSFIASQAAKIRSGEEYAGQLTALLWEALRDLREGVNRAHVEDALLQSPYVSAEDKARLRDRRTTLQPLPTPKGWGLGNVLSILRNCVAGMNSDLERPGLIDADRHAYQMRREAYLFAIELLAELKTEGVARG